jgi:hypothetical protein
MKGDAITRFDAARRQAARETFGFGRKPFVSPDFFVKDECCAFWPSKHLVHQSSYWSHGHSLVSRFRYAAPTLNGLRYRAISVSGKTVAIVGERPNARRNKAKRAIFDPEMYISPMGSGRRLSQMGDARTSKEFGYYHLCIWPNITR